MFLSWRYGLAFGLCLLTPFSVWAGRSPNFLVVELASFELLGEGDPDRTQDTHLVLMASCRGKVEFLDQGPYSLQAKDELVLAPRRKIDLRGRATPPRFIFTNQACGKADLLLIDKDWKELAKVSLDLSPASEGTPFAFDEKSPWGPLKDHKVRVEGVVYPAHGLDLKEGETRSMDDTLRKGVAFRNRADDAYEYLYVFRPLFLYAPKVDFPVEDHVFFLELELCGEPLRYNPFAKRGHGIRTQGRGYEFEETYLELPSAYFFRQGGPDDETWSLSVELILQRSVRFTPIRFKAPWLLSDKTLGHGRFDCHDVVLGKDCWLSGSESDFIRLSSDDDEEFEHEDHAFVLKYEVVLLQVKKI